MFRQPWPPAAALDSPNLWKGTEFISIHYGLGVAHLLSSCNIQMVTHLFSSFKDFQEFCKEDIRHFPPPAPHKSCMLHGGWG